VRSRPLFRYTWAGLRLLALAALLVACTPPLPPAVGQAGLPVNPSPVPGATLPALHIHTHTGGDVVVYVETATTPEQQERGLMYRTSLPPDQGMIFDFGQQTTVSFWMENTLIPLSIAWFTHEGTIVGLDDMEAQTETLHTPPAPYWYALEVNKGFFAAHGIQVGDTVTVPAK
jgi:uncharacterized membrane protein (UPF0127 family)